MVKVCWGLGRMSRGGEERAEGVWVDGASWSGKCDEGSGRR